VSDVRVRFAPSPTGFLHVGGARTALFNWLHARRQGGRFILRIEDTDQVRSTEESYAAILRGMEWLGLGWDEGPRVGGEYGPYLQSERLEIYRRHLEILREAGHVYPSYLTPEEIRQAQAEAQARGRLPDYGRDLPEAERAQLQAAGRPEAWRLRTPDEGATFWYDLVAGKLEFQNAVLADRVVFKADGFPTYNFAVVVDDHLMGISHVLRGDDHVSNTPFQLLIYDAFGWPRPKLGHMPMILGPDRKRLSKRHGATSIEEFAAQGILPEAMVNYLALLGWSIGASGDEVMTREQLIQKFSLRRVNSSPAAFDYDKLHHLNAEHLRRLPLDQRVRLARPLLDERGWRADAAWQAPGGGDTDAYLARVLEVLGARFSDLPGLPDQIAFLFTDEYPLDEEAMSRHLGDPAAREWLAALAADLAAAAAGATETAPAVMEPWPAERFEQVVRATAERLGIKLGQVVHPCRVALTGQERSASMFEVMELLGLPRVMSRLARATDESAS
jgi:glutamyl-tRNA synthetase